MKRFLKEPLVHFLALGAIVFLVFQVTGDRSDRQDSRIVVTPGKVEQFVVGFTRTWQRPPTHAELDGLIEDYIMEEVLYREALAMGLDKDDTIVRRRMRQKIEFLTGDATASPATDEELQAWLENHPDQFRIEPKLALRQVYVNVHRRGNAASDEAAKLLDSLNKSKADGAALGDPSLLPYELPLSSANEITQVFGDQFVGQLPQLEPGRWAGPLQSAYGLHLVYVSERTEGKLQPLAEVRVEVQREWLAARHKEMMDATFRKLREKYLVVVQSPEKEAGPALSGNNANATEQQR